MSKSDGLVEGQVMCDSLLMGRESRIIQIHPTLRCNLACLHCYSNSAPGHQKELNIHALKRFLEQAYDEGYNVLSLSGGEPFLYTHLGELLAHARRIGYFNSITTSAMLLDDQRKQEVLQHADLVAVSIDGDRDLHNHIRGNDQAFDEMLQGVSILREAGKPLGFIHTITTESWTLLPWLAEFAVTHQARLLQLHPLESVGRARTKMADKVLDEILLHKLFVLHFYLQTKYGCQLFIQSDLLHRAYVVMHPELLFPQVKGFRQATMPFSDLLHELIIDERGDILPLSHGFSRQYRLGNISDFEGFGSTGKRYLDTRYDVLQALYQSAYAELLQHEDMEIFNWSEWIVEKSKTTAPSNVAPKVVALTHH